LLKAFFPPLLDIVLAFSLDQIWHQFIYDPGAKLLFTSGLFVFLFFVCMLVYWWLIDRPDARITWITLFSLYFYYKCAGHYWILHVVIVIVDFHLAQWIERSDSALKKKWLLVLSLVLNLGILVGFKYTNYFAAQYCTVAGCSFTPWDIILPVGVSFFTFQSLSYTLDVYRGELKALDSILDYAFFVTFFPQMVAGPIVRAADFLPQIRKPLFLSRDDFGRAVFLICIGLFKKSVIANYISTNFVDRVFETPEKYTGLENLFGVYGYALQIYCDFSAYSDMAIGIALLLGFTFNENFNAPYQSLSVTEFWRRWHISLSTWLRDYLYIPLGGNRGSSLGTWLIPGIFFAITLGIGVYKGVLSNNWWVMYLWIAVVSFYILPSLIRKDKQGLATGLNLLSTMLLGGLWHGAADQFIIWGLLHGLALTAERWWRMAFPIKNVGIFRKAMGWIWTFHFICFCWIFFRATDLQTVQSILLQIGTSFNAQLLPAFLNGYPFIVFFIGLGYLLHFIPNKMTNRTIQLVTAMPLVFKALLILIFAILVMQVKSSDVQEFIYFDF
jgi:alginate O-acetyltransferase complex protein AlgI